MKPTKKQIITLRILLASVVILSCIYSVQKIGFAKSHWISGLFVGGFGIWLIDDFFTGRRTSLGKMTVLSEAEDPSENNLQLRRIAFAFAVAIYLATIYIILNAGD